MYIVASVFFSKKTINTYLKLKIRVACREFLAFNYLVIVFFVIRNLENTRLKPVFRYAIFICICVDRKRILNGYCVVEKLMLNVRI